MCNHETEIQIVPPLTPVDYGSWYGDRATAFRERRPVDPEENLLSRMMGAIMFALAIIHSANAAYTAAQV